MEKIKNICCDLGRAFTIGLLSGGAAAAVLLLGGFLFGGFTFRVHFAVLGYKSVFAVLCVSWVLWAAAADYLLYRM